MIDGYLLNFERETCRTSATQGMLTSCGSSTISLRPSLCLSRFDRGDPALCSIRIDDGHPSFQCIPFNRAWLRRCLWRGYCSCLWLSIPQRETGWDEYALLGRWTIQRTLFRFSGACVLHQNASTSSIKLVEPILNDIQGSLNTSLLHHFLSGPSPNLHHFHVPLFLHINLSM